VEGKTSRVAILISGKVEFKPKLVRRDTDGILSGYYQTKWNKNKNQYQEKLSKHMEIEQNTSE
jgi:hypothetical protein